jgi:hypothetical protein
MFLFLPQLYRCKLWYLSFRFGQNLKKIKSVNPKRTTAMATKSIYSAAAQQRNNKIWRDAGHRESAERTPYLTSIKLDARLATDIKRAYLARFGTPTGVQEAIDNYKTWCHIHAPHHHVTAEEYIKSL